MPIVALLSDLIFESKIAATARRIGCTVRFVRTAAAVLEELERDPSSVVGVVVDLNLAAGDGLALIQEVKVRCPARSVVAYASHVQAELLRAARAAGADAALPRSQFSDDLPAVLQRVDASAVGPGDDPTVSTPP